MKVDEPLFSALPYRPEILRDKNLYAIGHPDLVPVLKKLAEEKDLDLPGQSQVIKEHPNLIVQTSLLRDNDFPWPRQVIKQFRWRGIQNYLASPLKKSKAIKSYLAACHLLKHGLGTPMPLGAVEVRSCGFVRENLYLTEEVKDPINLLQLLKKTPHGEDNAREVVRQLAEYVLRMHDSGLWHRDLNITNFLLQGTPGKWRLYLLDLNRAIKMPHLPSPLRAHELSRLKLKKWPEVFFEYYCMDRFSRDKMLNTARKIRSLRRKWRDRLGLVRGDSG